MEPSESVPKVTSRTPQQFHDCPETRDVPRLPRSGSYPNQRAVGDAPKILLALKNPLFYRPYRCLRDESRGGPGALGRRRDRASWVSPITLGMPRRR
jgi:hypothetical protein